MAQFTAEFWQDLRKPMRDRYGGAVLYTGNASANVLTVHLTENGEPYTGGGTISGTAIRANSTTVPLTDGSISADGTITVTLIPNCYLVAGYLHVYINVTTGSTVTTVLSVIYSVNATSSGTPIDPSGEITLDVNTLVNRINTATATIPASYETLMYSVAPAYSDLDFPIDAGLQLCWYDGQLYVNNVDIAAAESWTPAHWDACDVSGQIADVLADVAELTAEVADIKSVNKIFNRDVVGVPNPIDTATWIDNANLNDSGATKAAQGWKVTEGYIETSADSYKISYNNSETMYIVQAAGYTSNGSFVRMFANADSSSGVRSFTIDTTSVDKIRIATRYGNPILSVYPNDGKIVEKLASVEDDVSDLKSEINGLTVEETLLRSDLPGTTVTVTFDSNDNPVSIVHSANGTTVRTDAFVWGTDTVTETRTASDKYITITTNLTTLAQTVSEIQEVA